MNLKPSHDQLRRRIFFWLLLFVVTGWASAYGEKADFAYAKKADPEYDKIYPYYVEVCAVSRIRPLNGPEGGGWGHALMFLKGVCIDEGAKYPKVRVCGENEVDIHSPEAGVGISVDKMFKSVNWMAVPGKELLFHGNLGASERVTQEHFDATVHKALELNLFRGIEFHKIYLEPKPENESAEKFVARQALGTDYALKFARTSLCARLPVTKEMIPPMVKYLNKRNEEIFSGKMAFEWSAYYDNCAHTVHNTFAAAGIWDSKLINQFKVKQFFNKAIPSNEFIDFAFLIKDRPGALLKIIPAHEPNDLFGADYKLYVLEGPLRKPKTKKVRKLLSDPRHTDLETNLLYFKNRDEAILSKGLGRLWRLFHSKSSESAHEAYRRSIEDELADIIQKLHELAA